VSTNDDPLEGLMLRIDGAGNTSKSADPSYNESWSPMYTVIVPEPSSGVEQCRSEDDTKDAAEESPSIPNAHCSGKSAENDLPLTLSNVFPPASPTDGLIVVNIGRETYSKVTRETTNDSESDTMATETFPTA
jgi:hypothetical protein